MSDLVAPTIPIDDLSVTENERSNVRALSFAIQVSVTDMMDFDEASGSLRNPSDSSSLFLDKGVVGTIIMMNDKSALVWFGWGSLAMNQEWQQQPEQTTQHPTTQQSMIGKGTNLHMGPLLIGMPRTKYHGAFSDDPGGSVSKLIGSDSEDEETLARNMAARLSMKLGIPVMLSCSFEGCPASLDDGLEANVVQYRAAAQAERKIFQLLQSNKID